MALQARDTRISRRSWLLAGLAIPLFRARAESLEVSFDGDNLRPVALNLHFLAGKALERLRCADTVLFLSQVTLFQDDHATVFRQVPQRFYVSYDVWEERFKVTIPGATPQSRWGLTAAQAESWCMENATISALGMAPDRYFWLRFDLRTADPKDFSQLVGDSGISIRALIEMFSRTPGPREPRWILETRMRLRDLRRTLARGVGNG
jgi:hypothetical protein